MIDPEPRSSMRLPITVQAKKRLRMFTSMISS